MKENGNKDNGYNGKMVKNLNHTEEKQKGGTRKRKQGANGVNIKKGMHI